MKIFGERIIHLLLVSKKVQNFADIYKLRIEDFIEIRKMIREAQEEDKRAELKWENNLITAINKSKENDLPRLITALGIDGMGAVGASKLASKFKNLYNIQTASFEQLIQVENVGEVLANNIIKYFADEKNLKVIKELEDLGLNFDLKQKPELESDKLKGKKFAITGKFEISRNEIKEEIIKAGGEVFSTISGNVDYLIVGIAAGSKLEKAKEKQIKIITKEQLDEMLND